MAVNKQRICDVARNHGQLIYVYIVDIVNNLNASALSSICRLHDPNVLLAVVLLQLLVVLIELAEFIG